jgi:hypothetical protein
MPSASRRSNAPGSVDRACADQGKALPKRRVKHRIVEKKRPEKRFFIGIGISH